MDQYLSVVFFLDKKYGDVLVFGIADCNFQTDRMKVAFNLIRNPDIVDIVVTIQIEVINFGFFVIEFFLKTFQCFGFLKKFHYCVKIQIIAWKVEFFLFGLCDHSRACRQHRNKQYVCSEIFHNKKFKAM